MRERQLGTRVWPIGANTIDQYITSRNPDIPISLEPLKSFAQLFDKLRPLPQEIQQSLLTSFFVTEANFPNGEHLAHFLAKINNIDWFINNGTVSISEIQNVVDEHYVRLNDKPKQIIATSSIEMFQDVSKNDLKKTRYFSASYDAGATSHFIARHNTGRASDLDLASHLAFDAVSQNAERKIREQTGGSKWDYLAAFAAWSAQHVATWIVVEDEMPNHGKTPNSPKYNKGNPWEILFDGIWDKGLAYIESYKLEPIIFVPPTKAA